uniref:Lipocalin/cytosolic fatty-acid binding domain-containing protein n=1 Tax=Odontella aurita TaxID=265563 RepID=A0A7S4J9T7_9STRA|mmetsp:Transcript_42199/g.128026  ORF Transcript_42199/g.128026 Transcript_42199/m.128026 type:complete len:191 (+) Transcript_42199:167-739(+)|eukprot:CAMPEP_0113551670 /NCGR_PEP_ID=MMETSP0015_2-20120614/14648_1 /TAXON_ID=2838 /ORGANISM="Odontella" /LENGTH=190 /DNA_ID=CAMNT_0000452577 /DNA_START=102 /DNA_END=674 /DNA_ORIENTATION=+ /assembly_acc=CAM_ASM_000160
MGNLSTKTSLPPLQTVPRCETAKFMGTWFVVGVKPTYLETTCSNAVENYTLLEGKKHDVDIDFQYNDAEPITSKLKSLPQRGWVQGEDKSNSSQWKVSPFGPVRMPFPIIELDDDRYDYCVVGYPSRDYCWIMSRKPVMAEDTYDMLTKRLTENHQYDLEGLRRVPQKWTKEERSKRGLDEVIPDDVLSE